MTTTDPLRTDDRHVCGSGLGPHDNEFFRGSLLNPLQELTPQARFDAIYISSNEIAADVGVSRTAVLHARKRGLLPDPIVVNGNQIIIWERDVVAPFVAAWKTILGVRRAGAPVKESA